LLELQLQEYSHLVDEAKQSSADENRTKEAAIQALGEKIILVLDSDIAKYEPDQAFLLTSMYGFTAGSCYLLEQMSHTTELLLRLRIEAGDERGLFKLLRREGRKDPGLYVQVLRFFVDKASSKLPQADNNIASEDEDDDRWDSVLEVLSLIEKEGALSPMQVCILINIYLFRD
jgi:hypothetical protein